MGIMRIEDQRISAENIYEIIFEHFPDIIHSVDTEGNIVFTNRQAEKLLGYPREELLSMNVRDIYADDVLKAMQKGFKNLKKKGDLAVESALKDRYGNRIPVEIRSFSIYDDKGEFIRTFSILRDIRQVKDLQESLIHSERLAAIGELASGIAHDINNPLSVISMSLDMMREDIKKVASPAELNLPTMNSYVEGSAKASRAIQKLVVHLRDFSRSIKDEGECFDLKDVVNDAAFLVGSKVKNVGAQIVMRLNEDMEYDAFGSPNHLEQVFANLISNACDALEGRHERLITIDVRYASRNHKAYWRVDVIDTGCGIPKDVQESIFESFFTTKEKGKGTGLGLAIVRGIAKDHGGFIELESTEGRGTIFSVYIPKVLPGDHLK